MKEVEDGFPAGKNQYKFMRAFFGLVCSVIGVVAGLSTKGRPPPSSADWSGAPSTTPSRTSTDDAAWTTRASG